MKRQHKYFVNRRHSERLLARYRSGNPGRIVYFLTKKPDPRYQREVADQRWYIKHCPQRGKSTYRYHDEPEVEYHIGSYKSNGRHNSRRLQYYKRTAARRARHQKGELMQGSAYKKMYDIWWNYD